MMPLIWLTDMPGFIKALFGIGMPCLFQLVTGLYCPGCGGTRAVIYLLRGDVRMSFRYHPLVLYVAAVAVLETVSWTVAAVFHRPGLYIRRYRFFTVAAAGVVLANWIWKNFMLIVFGVDLLP